MQELFCSKKVIHSYLKGNAEIFYTLLRNNSAVLHLCRSFASVSELHFLNVLLLPGNSYSFDSGLTQ